jgi:hypothetical protein
LKPGKKATGQPVLKDGKSSVPGAPTQK